MVLGRPPLCQGPPGPPQVRICLGTSWDSAQQSTEHVACSPPVQLLTEVLRTQLAPQVGLRWHRGTSETCRDQCPECVGGAGRGGIPAWGCHSRLPEGEPMSVRGEPASPVLGAPEGLRTASLGACTAPPAHPASSYRPSGGQGRPVCHFLPSGRWGAL